MQNSYQTFQNKLNFGILIKADFSYNFGMIVWTMNLFLKYYNFARHLKEEAQRHWGCLKGMTPVGQLSHVIQISIVRLFAILKRTE